MRPQQGKKLRENDSNEGENDRMNVNDFCFLHCITTHVCWRVATIVLVPQNDPGAGQRCVLNKEKMTKNDGARQGEN